MDSYAVPGVETFGQKRSLGKKNLKRKGQQQPRLNIRVKENLEREKTMKRGFVNGTPLLK